MKKKTARIELKVEPEWKDRVVKAAKDSKRSVNTFIETAVDKELAKTEDDKWLES